MLSIGFGLTSDEDRWDARTFGGTQRWIMEFSALRWPRVDYRYSAVQQLDTIALLVNRLIGGRRTIEYRPGATIGDALDLSLVNLFQRLIPEVSDKRLQALLEQALAHQIGSIEAAAIMIEIDTRLVEEVQAREPAEIARLAAQRRPWLISMVRRVLTIIGTPQSEIEEIVDEVTETWTEFEQTVQGILDTELPLLVGRDGPDRIEIHSPVHITLPAECISTQAPAGSRGASLRLAIARVELQPDGLVVHVGPRLRKSFTVSSAWVRDVSMVLPLDLEFGEQWVLGQRGHRFHRSFWDVGSAIIEIGDSDLRGFWRSYLQALKLVKPSRVPTLAEIKRTAATRASTSIRNVVGSQLPERLRGFDAPQRVRLEWPLVSTTADLHHHLDSEMRSGAIRAFSPARGQIKPLPGDGVDRRPDRELPAGGRRHHQRTEHVAVRVEALQGVFEHRSERRSPVEDRLTTTSERTAFAFALNCVGPTTALRALQADGQVQVRGNFTSADGRASTFRVDGVDDIAIDFAPHELPTIVRPFGDEPAIAVHGLRGSYSIGAGRRDFEITGRIRMKLDATAELTDDQARALRDDDQSDLLQRFGRNFLLRHVTYRNFIHLVPFGVTNSANSSNPYASPQPLRRVEDTDVQIVGQHDAADRRELPRILLHWAAALPPLPIVYDPFQVPSPEFDDVRCAGGWLTAKWTGPLVEWLLRTDD